VHIDVTGNWWGYPGLRERKFDCILHRPSSSLAQEPAIDDLNVESLDDLNVESLLDDTVVVAAGADSRWTRRRKINLAELTDEPWILGAPNTWHQAMVAEIFQAQGLSVPEPRITTVSIPIRARLLAASPYLTMFGTSVLRQLIADHYAVTALPVDLPANPSLLRVVTLKNRTLSPVVERFLVCVREVAASFAGQPAGERRPRVRRPNGR
jgi:DNA-binding transcriptional LysR family regulator